ncbi:MAG TPA: Gldg family protein [Pseudobacter sp.]|nr:Gldg family protein [Pseudobacter sp.]
MKKVFQIAGNELRNLFYSPVAWFLTIAFMVQCAYFYTMPLYLYSKIQDLNERNKPPFKGFGNSLTEGIFLDPTGIFTNVLQNLYLFVPLLTMGLISREFSNGTVKLLYSSPVKLRQIVFGKYLAIMVYNLILLLVLGIFMVAGLINIVDPDYGLLLSAALGFYLLMCAYTAIGMFMSSLTTYQIVSAVGTFLLIFVLTRIGGLWQQYDFLRDLTYFLSIAGRTVRMLKGLITTNDLIYFVLVVGMFLAFTLLRLKGARESKPWTVKAARYLAVVVSVILIGYCASRPGYIGYWDTTVTQRNTIHERSQKILKEMESDPVEVTMYVNLLGDGVQNGLPAARNNYVWTLWEQYMRFKPEIQLKYVYYYDIPQGDSSKYKRFPGKNMTQIATELAGLYDVNMSLFKKPEELRQVPGLKDEIQRLVMQVKYKGRTEYLRTFPDGEFWPNQQNVNAVFKRLLQAEMPNVYYASGFLERDIYKSGEREYSNHSILKTNRLSLINTGFKVDTISLGHRNLPDNANILVLADPKVDLSDTVKNRIGEYLNRGGNMFILGEVGKQHVLNPVLAPLGAAFMNGNLIEVTKNEMPHHVLPALTKKAIWLAEERQLLGLRKEWDTARALMPGAMGITFSGMTGYVADTLFLTSGRNTWTKVGKLVTDSAAPVFSTAEGDYQQPAYVTGIALKRQVNNREQRIIVTGDADFMSNLRASGSYLGRAIYSWLDYNRYAVYTPEIPDKDVLLNTSVKNAEIMGIIFIYILPAVVLVLGMILLIRRKRQ